MVNGDSNQLERVFTNLLLNAAQAMDGQGSLTVRSYREGDRCRVDVVDTGPGIPAEVRSKVLEPFFTTKPRGTGLGLAICKQVIEQHGGQLSITCPAKGGTVVAVTLPLA